MRKLGFTLFIFLLQMAATACPVCERNKPKFLQGITHNAGPGGWWDYTIVVGAIIVTLLTLLYSIKWLLKPNETNQDHIKFSILNDQ